MESIFYEILDMSIKACWLIPAVLLARLLLRKAPKNIRCILWALVAVRLILPFSVESAFSLVPSEEDFVEFQGLIADNENEVIVEETEDDNVFHDNQNFENENSVKNKDPYDWLGVVIALPYAWIYGVLILSVYSVICYIGFKKKVKVALLYEEETYLCDSIESPFILGLIKPCIYLPSEIKEKELEQVLYHERTHIMRFDHCWKFIGFVLLLIHWFNPLVWLSYILFSKDLELACDEHVVKDMSVDERKIYSTTLLYFSVPNKNMVTYPLAFGEIAVKDRVKSALDYKKPAFWIVVLGIASCIMLAMCFLTTPKYKPVAENIYSSSGMHDVESYDIEKNNKIIEEYEEHIGECTVDYFSGEIDFVEISEQSFNNGDDALYIEPKEIDDEHYGVYIHFEDASGTIDTLEFKLPNVRNPLYEIPAVSIEVSNSSKKELVNVYKTYLNNWNGKENGRTPDLFEEIDFNEKNTPLFKVPDWQEFRAGEIILQFPEGLCPDKADVEDVVLNDDGSIRYKGRDDEVVFRGADTSRINDTVAFSLANHSSISLYEDVSEEDALTKPFYRGYKVRCYWATTDGLQSITYLFVIRTQYNGS